MADEVLQQDVIDVLSRAEVIGSALRLPAGQLDRKLYERVDKALRNAGGKWNTKARAHIFASDAAPKLAAMLGTGVAVDERKLFQTFFTPADLARRVARIADVQGHVVLEPSAGRGALADACMEMGAKAVHCIDVNPDFADELRTKYQASPGDFLQLHPTLYYRRIVMNPPFTGNQDIAHVRHALKWLEPGGSLTAIMLNNQTRREFIELVAEYNPAIEELAREAFKESGAGVSTVIAQFNIPA